MSSTQASIVRRRLTQTGIAVGVAVSLIALAGCARSDGSGGGDCSAKPITQFAVVTPETEADHGWNQMGIVGATNTADALGIKADVNSGVGYDNAESILTQVADKGNQLVIAHASGFAEAGQRVAETTGTPVLGVDYETLVPNKFANVTFEAQQGGYLAGVAAANMTKTGTLGIVASAEDLNWFTMSGGFVQGAYSVNPDVNIVFAIIGPAEYGDSAGGERVAQQVIAAGADVVFGMGDGATQGYLQAVETASSPVIYIATIGDVSEIDPKGVTATSVLWNFGDAYKLAIDDINTCKFGTKNYTLDVPNGGIALMDTGMLSADAKSAADKAKAGITDGSITVNKTTTKDEVDAAIAAHGK